jgi:hypothetical protein
MIWDCGMWKFHRGSPYENLINFLDFGYRILDFGYLILDFGCRILDFGYRILDFGYRILDTGFWIPGFLQNTLTSVVGSSGRG